MPYLSIVMTSRNDNYGGHLLHRMEACLNSILTLSEKYAFDVELILVEWNPPKDKPLLREVLKLPQRLDYANVRFVEVPPEIHNSLPNSEKQPIFEYHAKNVGIRRAKGEFILATNPDLIYNGSLIKFLSSKQLSKESFYRITRYDIDNLVPLNLSIEEQLEFCAKHVVKIHDEKESPFPKKLLKLTGLRITSQSKDLPWIFYESKDLPWIFYELVMDLIDQPSSLFDLHHPCSGDFLLTAKRNWCKIRGYPEVGINKHIDSYGLAMLAALGLHQVVLEKPLKIYHQEHKSQHSERPQADFLRVIEKSRKMLKSRRPAIFNGKNWGLGDKQLPEYTV